VRLIASGFPWIACPDLSGGPEACGFPFPLLLELVGWLSIVCAFFLSLFIPSSLRLITTSLSLGSGFAGFLFFLFEEFFCFLAEFFLFLPDAFFLLGAAVAFAHKFLESLCHV
jgi:hypothetical protein